MVLKNVLKRILKAFGLEIKESGNQDEFYKEKEEQEIEEVVMSLWDLLSIQDNSQAFHLINVIGFEEWIDMEEIRRRIKELFNVEYKNEKSLYAHTKTLVDLGLIETISAGGRRKWRKKELLLKTKIRKIRKKEKEQTIIIEE